MRIFVCLLLGLALVWSAIAADAAGKWSGTFTPENGNGGYAYVILKQSGSTLTGSAGGDPDNQWPGLQGTIKGNNISFQVKSAEDGVVYKCNLVLDGDHMKGDVAMTFPDGRAGKGKLDLERVK